MEAEKMKIVAVGTLVVCVLGVGAFQFLQTGETPPATVEKKPAPKPDADAPKGPMNPAYAAGLAMRDPFAPADFARQAHEATLPPKAPTPPASMPSATPPPSLPGTPGGYGSGSIPPLPVAPPSGGTTVPTSDVPAADAAPVFHFRLTGVIDGARPAAIFDDGEGHQRLVAVGGEIGEGAVLLRVSPSKAVVRFAGDTLTLRPKSAPKAPKSSAAGRAPASSPSGSSAPLLPSGSLPSGTGPDLDAAARDAAKRLQGDTPQ